MSDLDDQFLNRHVILPVIHVESDDQVRRNTALARDAGADGALLINHSMPADMLMDTHRSTVREQTGWFVGVNCLSVHPTKVFSLPSCS